MIVNPYINPYDISYQLYQNLNLLTGVTRLATHLGEFYMVSPALFSGLILYGENLNGSN
jgi:hypothetical protein